MKILMASNGLPTNNKTWSGTPFHIYHKLTERKQNIIPLDLSSYKEPWYFNWLRRFYWRISKKWFLSSVEPYVLKQQAKMIEDEVQREQPDIVILMHADFLAYTNLTIPCITIHDTTFNTLVGYYTSFSNLASRSIKNGNKMYQLAMNKASATIFSSEWASKSALLDYNADKEKVFTIPLGANLLSPPVKENVEDWILRRSESDTCIFLFLGIDWERKGGPDSIHFIKKLNENNIKSKLIIIGCKPELQEEELQYTEIIGFLDKKIPEENEKLLYHIKYANALLLPSIAECYGCVFCEANAYGLPAIGRDTGGIPEIIKEDINGFLLKEDLENLVFQWSKTWQNKEEYIRLSKNSRMEYESRLNYDVFVDKIECIAKNILKN